MPVSRVPHPTALARDTSAYITEPLREQARDVLRLNTHRLPMGSLRFVFHPLTEADLPLLHDWLSRPHLQAWWRGEASLTEVRDAYLPCIAARGAARPYLAYLDGQPVGYIQYYVAAEGIAAWWPDEPGPGVLGIDQFLADGERLNQGIGTAMVSQFAALLMEDPRVTEIRVDPSPDNVRAIRCYAKVGFRAVGPITTPDGPALMMVLDRQAALGGAG